MNYKQDKWYNPDKIYLNDSQYHHIIAYIYDSATDFLYYIKESDINNSKSTHKDIIINNIDTLAPLIDNIIRVIHEKRRLANLGPKFFGPYYFPTTLQALLQIKKQDYFVYSQFFQTIREQFEDTYSKRFVFGRSGINIIQIDSTKHINDDTALHSFWKDYNEDMINNAITKVIELDPDYKEYTNYISRPSGTTLLNQRFVHRPDAEDTAKQARIAHLMSADKKKAELLSQGAKPKELNPWKREAMQFGYAEPWRMSSESIHTYTQAYKLLVDGLFS